METHYQKSIPILPLQTTIKTHDESNHQYPLISNNLNEMRSVIEINWALYVFNYQARYETIDH